MKRDKYRKLQCKFTYITLVCLALISNRIINHVKLCSVKKKIRNTVRLPRLWFSGKAARTLSSSRVHHTLSVTHGQFSRVHSNTVYYLRPRLYIRTYECLDGEQGLTADGLGTPFARAQPRLGKHPQHSSNARIVCIYCTEHEQFKYTGKGARYCNSSRMTRYLINFFSPILLITHWT